MLFSFLCYNNVIQNFILLNFALERKCLTMRRKRNRKIRWSWTARSVVVGDVDRGRSKPALCKFRLWTIIINHGHSFGSELAYASLPIAALRQKSRFLSLKYCSYWIFLFTGHNIFLLVTGVQGIKWKIK